MPEQNYIIVIDDSKEDAMLIERVINKANLPLGLRWIGNAEKALHILLTEKLSNCVLVLLDIKMPLLTGLEVLDRLQSAERLRHCPPIIVFSSSNQEKDLAKVAEFSGVRYQTKPEGYLDLKKWIVPLLQTFNAANHD